MNGSCTPDYDSAIQTVRFHMPMAPPPAVPRDARDGKRETRMLDPGETPDSFRTGMLGLRTTWETDLNTP